LSLRFAINSCFLLTTRSYIRSHWALLVSSINAIYSFLSHMSWMALSVVIEGWNILCSRSPGYWYGLYS
jgi:hypothetical protein